MYEWLRLHQIIISTNHVIILQIQNDNHSSQKMQLRKPIIHHVTKKFRIEVKKWNFRDGKYQWWPWRWNPESFPDGAMLRQKKKPSFSCYSIIVASKKLYIFFLTLNKKKKQKKREWMNEERNKERLTKTWR
jgi:hypothetical protein